MTSRKPPLSLNAWLRWDVVRAVLDKLDGIGSALEIGPGSGAISVRLALRYDYVGVDRDVTSVEITRKRLARIGRGSVLLGDLAEVEIGRAFDLVCAFEVLEHIERDSEAVREWAARLRPGGTLILSVPAWRKHWGASDDNVGHVRRYDRSDLVRVLESADLVEVQVLVYGFPLGYFLHSVWDLAAGRRRAERSRNARTASSGRWFQPRDELATLTQAVTLPFRLLQRPFIRTDLGTGFVAVARRRA